MWARLPARRRGVVIAGWRRDDLGAVWRHASTSTIALWPPLTPKVLRRLLDAAAARGGGGSGGGASAALRATDGEGRDAGDHAEAAGQLEALSWLRARAKEQSEKGGGSASGAATPPPARPPRPPPPRPPPPALATEAGGCDFDEVAAAALDADAFLRRYARAGRPVALRGALASPPGGGTEVRTVRS